MMKNVMHPGTFLQQAFIEPLKITAKELAERLDISNSTLSRLVNEKQDVDCEMAIRLSYVTGQSEGFWLNMQRGYSLQQARAKVDCNKLMPLEKTKMF